MKYQKYSLTDLTDRLIKLVKENLDRFSGKSKIFRVTIMFRCPIERSYAHEEGGWTNFLPHESIQIIFWHPSNSMTIAYHHIELNKVPIVFARNSSTWEADKLNFREFMEKNLEDPEAWKITCAEIVEIDEYPVGKEFVYYPTEEKRKRITKI